MAERSPGIRAVPLGPQSRGSREIEMPADREIRTPADVTRFLTGVRFPTDRDGLVAEAGRAGGPAHVIALLCHIDNRIYEGMAQVSEELGRLRFDEAGRIEPVDQASRDSFPASDAPGFGAPSGIGRPPDQ